MVSNNSQYLNKHTYFHTYCPDPTSPLCESSGEGTGFNSNEHKRFIHTTEINSDIEISASWNEGLHNLENFATRLENCKYMGWAHVICEDCGELLQEKAFRLTCLSPYCQNPECLHNKKRIARAYLKNLHIKSKNLLHIILGFEHMQKFSLEIRQAHNKVFSLLKKEMQRLGTPLHMIVVRDIQGKKKDLYVHYHTAQLPVRDWRKFRQNLFLARERIISKTKTEFSIKFKHYTPIKNLFQYFINRIAGIFGDVKKRQEYGYPILGYQNLIDIKDYFENFYNRRKFLLVNLRARALQGSSSVLAYVLDKPIEKCPYCGSRAFRLVPEDSYKPPLPKECSCGLLNLDRKDWNYQLGICYLCAAKQSPGFYIQKQREKFEEFLNAKTNS